MSLYLDNAATTQIRREVLDEMISSLKNYGNSESKYYDVAENAKKDIQLARTRIASSINCEPEEVVFTSGATEANNLVLKGLADASDKKTIIISAIEHSSIYESCEYLKSKGYNIKIVPVDNCGKIKLDILESYINDDVLLVSIIFVNNEIGTIQDISSLNDICKKHNVTLHLDATQAIGKVAINMEKYDALKFLTFSSHKIYGPKGIGALIIRKTNGLRTKLVPQIHGGEQEDNYRAGTLSNELIVGFGKACELICLNINAEVTKLKVIEKILIDKLLNKFGDKFSINNNWNDRIPGLLNVQIKGINNMVLLKKISPYIAASTGSACSVAKPSRVLRAIGLSDNEISYSIRLSVSSHLNSRELDIIDQL